MRTAADDHASPSPVPAELSAVLVLSALATNQPAPGAFGAGIRGFAQDPTLPPPGLGDGIQALQAGVVPDEVVLNTCND